MAKKKQRNDSRPRSKSQVVETGMKNKSRFKDAFITTLSALGGIYAAFFLIDFYQGQ